MSLSTSTFRAVSSLRFKRQIIAKPSTFLPFLYQTPTIQQCRSIRTPRGEFDSADDPLEFLGGDEEAPAPSDEQLAFHRQRPTTITDTERKAFLKLFNNLGQDTSSNTAASEDGATAMKDESLESLNRVFENVLRRNMPAGTKQGRPQRVSKALNAAKMAKTVIPQYINRTVKLDPEDANRLRKLRELQEEQYREITGMLSAAKTDTELWNILDKNVFTLIRNLDLDGTSPKKKTKKKAKTKKEESTATNSTTTPPPNAKDNAGSVSVIGPNFSSLLVTAVRQLRQEFPNSSLPLNLIPTIKALGRGAYVLGASTVLYNELIAMAWIKYADLQYVEELIQDMDNGGVDFDVNTLEMLDAINIEGQRARNQTYGHVIAAVWSLDRFVGGWAKLERWRNIIKDRLQADAIRKANSNELAFP